MKKTLVPVMRKAVRNPAVNLVATAASGIIRQMAIKPFTPKRRTREFLLRDRFPSFLAVRNQIYKEKGVGEIPTIVIGGFVPDATEAVEFQRPLLRSYGSIYYVNYPRNGFSTEMFNAQLADLIEDINQLGKSPVILSVSFGCGLVAQFLQNFGSDSSLKVKGAVMVSPVLCTADLVRPGGEKRGGVRMLESNLRRILKAEGTSGTELTKHIERARRCFHGLFETGAENRELTGRHLSIKKKVMEVMEKTTTIGGYERVLALNDFSFPSFDRPLFSGASLILVAEGEEDIMADTSPTLALLKDGAGREKLFPRAKVRTVTSARAADPVPHASLIFHQDCYNPHIETWYDRLAAPRLFAVV